MAYFAIVYQSNKKQNQKLSCFSLIQSGGGTKDLRSHGNPGKPEGANLSEQSNNKRIDDEISGQSFGTDL